MKLSVLIRQPESLEKDGELHPDVFLMIPKFRHHTRFSCLNDLSRCTPFAEKQIAEKQIADKQTAEKQANVMLYLSNPVKTIRYFA